MQRDVFLKCEGDAWNARNRVTPDSLDRRSRNDAILHSVNRLDTAPTSILEIGSANGWRLEALRRMTGAHAVGLEPSAEAVTEAAEMFPEIVVTQGTADTIPYPDASFDLLIFGFCLYLCDRSDLFRIAMEADRVLQDQGHLAIFDFCSSVPYRNPYSHYAGISSYKMDYSRMFLWNPDYICVEHTVWGHGGGPGIDPDARIALTMLRKDREHAWVECPWGREHGV